MTPNIAIIRVQNHALRGFPIVIPVFLLWIPVILLSPFILLVVFGVSIASRVNPWRMISAVWGVLCGLPGTDVRVCADGNRVTVRIL
jgi:hypothetical protein